MNDRDIRITPAISAYLAAFDYWLKHTWATGETGRMHDGATALKDVCFAEMTAAAGIPFYRDGRRTRLGKSSEPTCRDCGHKFTPLTNRGRPRVRCYDCHPARITASLPLAA
jgi:hypothetical protein